MEKQDFINAARLMAKMSYSDEELLLCVDALENLVSYFEKRDRYWGLALSELRRELTTFQGFVSSRTLKP